MSEVTRVLNSADTTRLHLYWYVLLFRYSRLSLLTKNTFIGQITLPSFIAEMKEPKDFPKALWAVTIAEVIVFSLVGAVVYGKYCPASLKSLLFESHLARKLGI